MSSPPIPVSDINPIHYDADEESPNGAAVSRKRCCYWPIPCMQSENPPTDDDTIRSNWWQSIADNGKDYGRRLWCKGVIPFNKIREWSELVAGPKWKTFIRRFKKKRPKHSVFQYDPASYSLNFDEGRENYAEDDDLFFRDFSSRYAASVPISAKSSMDLGKDGISFT